MADRPGEFEQIHRYFSPLAKDADGALGLGDDAALIETDPGTTIVVTSDMMVANVHFRADDPPRLVGQKLLRVNLSDLASMGAVPKSYTLGLATPSDITEQWIAEFAAGLRLDQETFGITLIGGDTVATMGPTALSVTAFGTVPIGSALKRSGAQIGDQIWVSGTIGDGALGLAVLNGELARLQPELQELGRERYQLPQPRLNFGRALRGVANSAVDVSDGLIADLGHICEQSGVGACLLIDDIPISPLGQAAIEMNETSRPALAAAGDDFELLFTAPEAATAKIEQLSAELSLPISKVGTITAGQQVEIRDAGGNSVEPVSTGYQHF